MWGGCLPPVGPLIARKFHFLGWPDHEFNQLLRTQPLHTGPSTMAHNRYETRGKEAKAWV